MTKYSNQFKELVVEECLENTKSLSQITRESNITSPKKLRTWIKRWRDHDSFEKTDYQYYSPDFKMTVLKYDERHTYIETVSEFDLNTNLIIFRWRKKFNEFGYNSFI